MKNLAGSLALILLNAGIIAAQEKEMTSNSIERLNIETYVNYIDNAVATDRDIIIKDRRTKEDG
ncbi:hypothetical protein, partial [Arenibacter lacus]|uniref:hypothetical protein n=1 Tax=Arenibacter lacus TaxID=2608629 RepID=UPI00123D42B6